MSAAPLSCLARTARLRAARAPAHQFYANWSRKSPFPRLGSIVRNCEMEFIFLLQPHTINIRIVISWFIFYNVSTDLWLGRLVNISITKHHFSHRVQYSCMYRPAPSVPALCGELFYKFLLISWQPPLHSESRTAQRCFCRSGAIHWIRIIAL